MNPLKEDPYKNVPNRGEPFIENGKIRYWNFSSAKIGTRIKQSLKAFQPILSGQNGSNVAYGPATSDYPVSARPGGSAVQCFPIQVFGFYYFIDQELECVDARNTRSGRITLWESHSPLTDLEQQALAFQATSQEEHEKLKNELRESKNSSH